MGTAIINGISAGFSILSDLAENLVTGFSTLFLDTSTSTPTLTGLGWFVMVMFGLGITITTK